MTRHGVCMDPHK